MRTERTGPPDSAMLNESALPGMIRMNLQDVSNQIGTQVRIILKDLLHE